MASLIHATAHGLSAGSAIRFGNLVPTDSGIVETTTYYVLAAGLTANDFQFSETPGGTAFVLNAAITDGVIRNGDTYEVVNSIEMPALPTLDPPTGLTLTSTVTIDADGHQIVRIKAALTHSATPGVIGAKVELAVTAGLDWATAQVLRAPLGTAFVQFVVQGNVGFSVRAAAEDVYGRLSAYTATGTITSTRDTGAPATPTGLAGYNGILSVSASWTANTEADLSYYELQLDDDAAFGSPSTYRVLVNVMDLAPLAAGTYHVRVRAVDTSGNASAYTSGASAIARVVETADIADASLSLAKFASTIRPVAIVGALPGLPDAAYPIGSTAVLTTNGKLYRNVANAWVTAIAGADVTGAVSSAYGIPAVGALPSLPDATYPQGALVLLTTDSKLYRNTTGSAWSKATDGADIAALTITAAQIAAGAITTAQIAADTIAAGNIAASAITSSELAANAVIAGKIAAGTIVAADIAADTITAGQLAAGAIGTSELAVGAKLVGEVANEAGVTPGVFIDSTGILIRSGKLTLQDEFGATQMIASGFSGSWSDFIATGIYNGAFRAGVAGAIGLGRTAALPYWTVRNNAGTTAIATFLNPGVKFTWTSSAGVKEIESDRVPVLPGQTYELTITYDVTRAAGDVVFELETTLWDITQTFSGGLSQLLHHLQNKPFGVWITEVTAGAAEYYFSLKLRASETVHSASNLINFWSFKLRPVTGPLSGVAFPVNPTTEDRFYRTDIAGGMMFLWDGTRWASVEVLKTQMMMRTATTTTGTGDLSSNIAATTSPTRAISPSVLLGGGIYLVDHRVVYFVAGGGTALGALHKWVGTFASYSNVPALLATHATVNIDSGASGVFRSATTQIRADPSNGTLFYQTAWTKTGTPGTLMLAEEFTYRIVAT